MEVPSCFKKNCIVVNDIFTKEECNQLKARMIDPLRIDTTVSEDTKRVVDRTSLKDPELAAYLYEKVAPICPSTWNVPEEDEHLGPFAQGDWQISNVDHRIQVYKYVAGGLFGKHRDKPTYYSVDKRSFFTVLVYLNDGYTGGHTTVFTDDLANSYAVPKSTGGCFAMLQRVLHEGSTVETGEKWALRCDVIYERVPGTSAEQTVKHLDKKEQAKRWFKLASAVELSGLINESVKYYQKAYKLDPNLEEAV